MISKRLRKILEIIPPTNMLADIGTDHGYIPVEAVKNKISRKAIASDISEGSLSKAINEIKKNKLENNIYSRLGSGISILEKDEADTVVIAGMGGILISEILKADYHKKFVSLHPLLILQPVQFPETLREYLYTNGFEICREELIEDDGKIYHIIAARYKNLKLQIKPRQVYELGEWNIRQNTHFLQVLIDKKIQKNKTILQSIQKSEKQITFQKKQELLAEIKIYEELKENALKRS